VGRALRTGPETRPAFLLCREVAVVAVSGERFLLAWYGRTAVVSASGEIDIINAEGFRDALLSALNAGAAHLVVDLTSVTFLDSAGVTALVRAARRATSTEASLRLAVSATSVLRVLNLVGIDRLIEVYQDLPGALASVQAPATLIDRSTHAPSGPDATDT
jgi:anti-sigma B factor antagonist